MRLRVETSHAARWGAGPDLAPHRAALEALLRAHEPHPAIVVDRHWTVVLANPASHSLYGGNPEGSNIIRMYVSDPGPGPPAATCR